MLNPNLLIEKLNHPNIPALRQLYGNDPEVLLIQAKRYQSVIHQFKECFGQSEVMLFSSPGRTEIGGNHTDHNNGRVLAGAVNLDNIAIAAPNHSDLIHIKSIGFPDFIVDLNELEIIESEFYSSKALVKGICFRLKELGYRIGGFNAVIEGRVPKGSGLSSSASFEVLIGAIVSHLFNDGKLDPVLNAKIGQWAENHFFGKPCGLMDQTACSVGGFISIDFEDTENPIVNSIPFDFSSTGFALVITDTGGNHANLNNEYAALPIEMKLVAKEMGANVLRCVSLEKIIEEIPAIREKHGDRAVLRAIHFQNDNQRVLEQTNALKLGNFKAFLDLVIESGYSSFMYNQNVYTTDNVREQGLSLGLALSEHLLKGKGAWRVHGGGFAGTIQAFVPKNMLSDYVNTLEHVFGTGKCHQLFIRQGGADRVFL